jgi:phosphoadenosine phosphosulfate reductase
MGARNSVATETKRLDGAALGRELAPLDAAARVKLLGERFAGQVMATSSFGLQAAVMLHLMKENAPHVPIVFIDTGYLFPETYRYVETLQGLFGFEAATYAPQITAARQAALHGRLWEQGDVGHAEYARINKIEPMNRALQENGADVWISGLRRSQSSSRSDRGVVEQQSKTVKVYPIIEWSDEEVEQYMTRHDLPRHPLAALGYQTMGDWHSTEPVEEGTNAEESRFGGQKYECGLHLESGVQDFQI